MLPAAGRWAMLTASYAVRWAMLTASYVTLAPM